MGTVSAEGIATEYKRLIDEGWSPDLDEFLHRVPEDLREECRQLIVELTTIPSEPESADKPRVISSVDDIEWLAEEDATPEPEHATEVTEEPPEAVEEIPEAIEGPAEEVPEPAEKSPEAIEEPPEAVEELPEATEEPPEAVEEPEAPAPTGPVRLSRDEAMQMFREMEQKRASAS
jgi:hypothetical protein